VLLKFHVLTIVKSYEEGGTTASLGKVKGQWWIKNSSYSSLKRDSQSQSMPCQTQHHCFFFCIKACA